MITNNKNNDLSMSKHNLTPQNRRKGDKKTIFLFQVLKVGFFRRNNHAKLSQSHPFRFNVYAFIQSRSSSFLNIYNIIPFVIYVYKFFKAPILHT